MLSDDSKQRIPARVESLARVRKTPFLAMEKKLVQSRFTQLCEAMPGVRVFYAIKANSHKRIVQLLQASGAAFEVASEEEMNLVLSCGTVAKDIITSNPLKSEAFIKAAHRAGVEYFAFDSHAEIEKLAKHAPGSKVYVRLVVPNEGSQWPLSKKFGVETEVAIELLEYAASKPIVPYGITFHVGSQCTNEISWMNAIKKAKLVWEAVRGKGIELKMLNIGGGFPIEYTTGAIPSIDRLGKAIRETLKEEFPPGIEVFAEPGRAVVGEAGILVCSVVAKAKRDGEDWLYLDAGVFTGLMESIGGIQYVFTTHKNGRRRKWVVAGPTCDSMDVISKDTELPDLEVGDRVYISSAGAYTTAYASRFNGFSIPKTYFF